MVMEKSKLEKFITKYNLGGSCESVTYKSDGNTLSVRTISGDKALLGEVSLEDIKFPSGEFSVNETKKFRSILSVLDDNLTIKPNITNGKATGLNLTDGSTKATFVLADDSIIPAVPDLKKLPPMDFAITLDEKFINTFVKAKNALADVDNFAVISKGEDTVADIVIGHSNLNTNRITVTAKTNKAVKMDPVVFSANYLREILNANKEITNGIFQVSSKGIAVVKFSDGVYTSTYYLVAVTV